MKYYISLLLLWAAAAAQAQTETWDLLTYTAPAGWQKETGNEYVSYSYIHPANKSWCRLAVYKSIASAGDADKDYAAEWNTLVEKPYRPSHITPGVVTQKGQWKFKTGSGRFRFNGSDALVYFTTITGNHACVSILAMTSSESYQAAIQKFLESATLPAAVNKPAQPADINMPAAATGYQFSSTNWDDGWTSTIKEDWVEVTKPRIRALLYYSAPGDVNSGWSRLIVPNYNITGPVMSDYGTPTDGGMAYTIMGADATEKNSGRRVYAAVFKGPGGNQVIGLIADSYDALKNELATVITRKLDWDPSQTKTTIYWTKVNDLYSRNKFAMGAGDVKGNWYYADTVALGNSSNYSAAAKNMITIFTHEFNFSAAGQYQYKAGSGSGTDTRSSAVKLIYNNYQGRYSVSNWVITLHETKFDAYFYAVKNGRLLVMPDVNGRSIFLRKIK